MKCLLKTVKATVFLLVGKVILIKASICRNMESTKRKLIAVCIFSLLDDIFCEYKKHLCEYISLCHAKDYLYAKMHV